MKPKEVVLIHGWANDPDILPLWYGREKSLEEIKSDWRPVYFSDEDPYGGRCYAIERRGEVIGMINHNRIDRDNNNTTIDVIIGRKDCWDRGFGTDALCVFCAFLFRTYDLHRIWLGTYAHNIRAIRAYEKVGFRREGLLREDGLIQGRYADTVIMGLLRRDFEPPDA
jgi:RimJ/RimL family protein N-acetyltransferase